MPTPVAIDLKKISGKNRVLATQFLKKAEFLFMTCSSIPDSAVQLASVG